MRGWRAPRLVRIAMAALAVAATTPIAIGPAVAADELDKLERGPKVGEKIPHALTAADQTGKRQDFNSVKSGRGLVILFNRSVDW